MKYVKAVWDDELSGYNLDPTAYLTELPQLSEALPPGARAFASAEGHYSLASGRCVKDLELTGISLPVNKGEENSTLTLDFAPNQWKHGAGLRIRYTGVSHFAIEYERSIDWMSTYIVLLDEALPQDGGCRHEIALTDASIVVLCQDLEATWNTPESM